MDAPRAVMDEDRRMLVCDTGHGIPLIHIGVPELIKIEHTPLLMFQPLGTTSAKSGTASDGAAPPTWPPCIATVPLSSPSETPSMSSEDAAGPSNVCMYVYSDADSTYIIAITTVYLYL